MTKPRKGQAPAALSRDAFGERFRQSFADPAFAAAKDAVERVEAIAWNVARALANAVAEARAGRLSAPDRALSQPRAK